LLTELDKVDPDKHYARLKKPWKGKAGREAAKLSAGADELARRAKQLHRDEPALTQFQIAKRLGLKGKKSALEKRISRYLKRR
jgi:hypothetical protein